MIAGVSRPKASPSLEVIRTFSPLRESESDETDWESWFLDARGEKTTWIDILKDRLVVVLGEAGIGKTYEFREQAKRLQAQGKAAFFIQLNLLDGQDWQIGLDTQVTLFEKWQGGSEPGFFFLDAVDEARLTGPAALHRALSCVKGALIENLSRVYFFVSSRISDWSLPAVRDLVQKQLALPKSLSNAALQPENGKSTITAVDSDCVPVVVRKLDPLSVESAKRLAAFYGVTAVDAFWQEVDDGNYRFLATRPLDLEWMAIRWMEVGRLGSFADIVEHGATNRLVEKNSGYIEAGAVLSLDQLRQGAETLAAASVLSSSAHIQVAPGPALSGEIAPGEVLPGWKANEHQRLLGAAIFDEATYGRVQFHHRAVREYLAAWWVKRQLDAGLPFVEAWALFVGAPYGEEVLIPSRRPVLCWLAALDARVRGRVIRTFPEMVIYEGDPQQWSVDDVVEAFERYLELIASGFRPDWWNDAAEYRRVARMIPAENVSRWIEAYRDNADVLPRLLTIVTYGRVTSCADQVFALYRDTDCKDGIIRYVLDTLGVIATDAQRTAVVDDLLSGRLEGNDLIADGISAVGLRHLSLDALVACFRQVQGEDGGGPMAMAVKVHLLPEADLADSVKLLAALLDALPSFGVRELTRGVDEEERKEGWILSVLPDALLRVLQLASTLDSDTEATIIEAAVAVEKLRHTSFANDEDFRNLREVFARYPGLRRALALRIAHCADILHASSTLLWGTGIVHLTREDLEWLIRCANDCSCDPADRAIWYAAARDIAVGELRGRDRKVALDALVSGPEADARRSDIEGIVSQRMEGLRQKRKWKYEDSARKAEARRLDAQNRTVLQSQIEPIRQGTSFNAIKWLVLRAAERRGRSRYTKVDVDAVQRDFGPELGAAFNEGLARAWRSFDAPDSTQYLDNTVPWAGLIGLASVNHAFEIGLDVTTLTDEEVEKVVRLCVWELDELQAWFARLVEARLPAVTRALTPWFTFELKLARDDPIRRTVEMVLHRGPPLLKLALLPIAVECIQTEEMPNERLRSKIVSEIVAAGLVDSAILGTLARRALEKGLTASPPAWDEAWFSRWARADLASAWLWFEAEHERWRGLEKDPVELFAQVFEESSDVWQAVTGTAAHVSTLVSIWHFLNGRYRKRTAQQEESDRWAPVNQVLDRIPRVLSGLRGKPSHQALLQLAQEHTGTPRGNWLVGKAREHAEREAEEAARIAAGNLPSIGEPFTREPRSETELFEQVMARLAEISAGVEKGPFSERGLFTVGIAEKQLQLWLAARLEDTPRRSFTARFSVVREPTVDAEKRTDIEVSTKVGKVCIEIKPLDETRSYSAQSLAEDTLKRQVVGQYLRGKNSKHGVLVICRLDRKNWRIPGIERMQGFDELVRYLSAQAQEVVKNESDVIRLEVLPIDCTLPP